MKVLIFNGSPEKMPHSVGNTLSQYFAKELEKLGAEVSFFSMAESDIPLLNLSISGIPESVNEMCKTFTEADVHLWLTPLYHGSLTGVMKNCLDWLELTSTWQKPYLTDKKVGLVCWADGMQAMQGINAMDAIVKALRGWTVPYAVPICRKDLYTDDKMTLSADYQARFQRLHSLLMQ